MSLPGGPGLCCTVPYEELRGKGEADLACQRRRELLTLMRAAGSQAL